MLQEKERAPSQRPRAPTMDGRIGESRPRGGRAAGAQERKEQEDEETFAPKRTLEQDSDDFADPVRGLQKPLQS